MKTIRGNDLELALKFALFCLLAYFPFFIDLGALPIRVWDESRVAVNAYEMSKNGNWLVSAFMGQPDMWNTKPPLLLWLQVLCSFPFGMGELAIRIPSAIAGFLTAAALVLFSVRYLKDYWFGLISALVLLTIFGYVDGHATRTGDYDALLALFTTLYPIFFFLFLEEGKKKYLHLFFLALILAVMTKGIQALIFLPALCVFAAIQRKVRQLIRERWFYIDLLLCFLIVGGFYFAREQYNPGYLKAVWLNEVVGRYSSAIEGHKGDFWFYYRCLTGYLFSNWHWLVPCGLAIGFFIRDSRIRKITLYISLLVFSYWLVISLGGTKLAWYIVPVYPFLAMIVSTALHYIFNLFKNSQRINRQFSFNVIPYIFLFVIFWAPYSHIIEKVYKPREYDSEKEFFQMSYYLRDALKSRHDVQDHYVCFDGYKMQLQLYLNLLNEHSRNVGIKDWENLQSGDLVITSQPNVQEGIESRYETEITENFNIIKKYKIHGTKPAK
jgi:4-amino-4-deoxy-L-arabinose transferase-like glycosyltransferase